MILTQEVAQELIDYNPRSGSLIWNVRSRDWFIKEHHWKTWNTRYANRLAGRIDHEGYRLITLLGERYRSGRFIWFWMLGEWPTLTIDHEDRNKQNDRWTNLNDVTRAANNQNQNWTPERFQRVREQYRSDGKWAASNNT